MAVETTPVNHIEPALSSVGRSLQFCDEAVEAVLQGLLKATLPSVVLNCTLV